MPKKTEAEKAELKAKAERIIAEHKAALEAVTKAEAALVELRETLRLSSYNARTARDILRDL